MTLRTVAMAMAVIAMATLRETHAVRTADEWRDRVIYHILTDRFAPKGETPTESCDELRSWCGGSFQGIIGNLDYIKNLGANAIWISPITMQTTGGYHGYWTQDLTQIEPHWGTEADLHALVAAAHEKDIWIMVDVVPNHMGYPEGCSDIIDCDEESSLNVSGLYPFNETDHYHELCQIDWSEPGPSQEEMELCRLANLPDLNQTVPLVRQTLKDWISNLTADFDIDGYRIDTVRHIEMEFWGEYREAAGTFCMGEVWHEEDSQYPALYQEHLDSITNYPLYRGIREAFHGQGSFKDFADNLADQRDNFQDTSVLTVFIDNHDVPRFLNVSSDVALFRNALAYIVYGEGIPMIYYGTEQEFNGGSDPENRESLWPHYEETSTTYTFLSSMLGHRLHLQVAGSPQIEYLVDDDVMVFGRSNDTTLVVISNIGSGQNLTVDVPNLPQHPDEGSTYEYVNVLEAEDVLTLSQDGNLTVSIMDGMPLVYERKEVQVSLSSVPGLRSHWLPTLTVGLAAAARRVLW